MAIGSDETRAYYAFLTSFVLIACIIAYRQLMAFMQQYPKPPDVELDGNHYTPYPPRTVSFWVMSVIVAILMAYPIYFVFSSD